MIKRRKIKNMTKFVITAIIHIDVFTLLCVIANLFDRQIQDAIITGFFSVFTGELAGMLLKKLLDGRKKKKGKNEDNTELCELEENEI